MAISVGKQKSKKALSKIPLEIQELKEFTTAKKAMGIENLAEHCLKEDVELAEHYTRNIVHIKETEQKVKMNSEYKKAQQVISDFNTALRNQLKPYKAVNALTASIFLHRKRTGELDEKVAESLQEFKEALPEGATVEISVPDVGTSWSNGDKTATIGSTK